MVPGYQSYVGLPSPRKNRIMKARDGSQDDKVWGQIQGALDPGRAVWATC